MHTSPWDLSPEYIQLLTWSYLAYGITSRAFWAAVATHVAQHAGSFTTESLAAVLWCHARAAALAPPPAGMETSSGIRGRQLRAGQEDPEAAQRAAFEVSTVAMYNAASNLLAEREAEWRAQHGHASLAEQLRYGDGHVPMYGMPSGDGRA